MEIQKKKLKSLHLCCESGDIATVKRHLSPRGMVVNEADSRGRYPLHLAVSGKHKRIIDLLMSVESLNLNVEDRGTGWNVLHFAALTGDKQLFYRLLSHPLIQVVANPNKDRNTPLHHYCRQINENYEDTFQLMLKKGAKVNCQNYNGETPLHNAAWKGHDVMCTLLLENGANPNQQNDHGETPLHWAARAGSDKVIRILIKGGADPTIQGASGTPYKVCLPIDLVKYLLREGKQEPPTVLPTVKDNPVATHNLSLTDKRKITPFHWEIDYSEIVIKREIGRGGFGVVYKGEWRGIEVAVKQIIKEKMSSELFERFLQEISIMSKLHHPNVLLLCGACLQPKICYVTEYMSQGSLRDVLNKKKKLEWRTKLSIAVETARGMKYLHGLDPPVLHHDLKSLNILIDENFHAKVADFGLSTLKEADEEKVVALSLHWVAPEVTEGEEYTEKSDVYSFGMVCWELITHKIPYEGKPEIKIIHAINVGLHPKFPKGFVESEYQQLVEECWKSPDERPDFNTIHMRLKRMKTKSKEKEEIKITSTNNNSNGTNSETGNTPD
jgi:ankyrin repeat protein/tRNA A-37 threonylcarbamoyl transferase component Bud32